MTRLSKYSTIWTFTYVTENIQVFSDQKSIRRIQSLQGSYLPNANPTISTTKYKNSYMQTRTNPDFLHVQLPTG